MSREERLANEESNAKLVAFRQRDAARKREQRKLAKLKKLTESAAIVTEDPANPPDGEIHDIGNAREVARQIVEVARRDAEALLQSAELQAREVGMQIQSQAKEKARAVERDAEHWARHTKEKCKEFVKKALERHHNCLPVTVEADPQRMLNFIEALPPVQRVHEDEEEMRLKRKREDDARRQRKCYERRKKEKGSLRPSDENGASDDPEHETPARRRAKAMAIIFRRGAASASSARAAALHVIQRFEHCTERSSFEFKKSVWRRIWRNARVEPYIPKVLSNGKVAEVMTAVFGNLKRALQSTKRAARKDHLAAKYTLLSGMIDADIVASGTISTLGRLLGIKKKTLLAAADRRAELDEDVTTLWPLGRRKTQSGRQLDKETKELVLKWWMEESRILPGRKDIVRHRIARNVYEIHTIQILDETQAEFFQRFKERYPEVIIEKRAFEKLKPYFIRVLKDRFVCCCQYHVQMDYLKDALNAMRIKLHRSEDCACKCVELCQRVGPNSLCQGHQQVFSSVTDLWELCVCPRQEGKAWHPIDCINGTCSRCGVGKLRFCPREDSEIGLGLEVSWRAFEYIEVYPNKKTPRGRDVRTSKRIKLVLKQTDPAELVNFVKAKLPQYIRHNFVAKWQTRAYQDSISNFPPGVILSVIDFAENYSLQVQNEIQSMHWHSDQVTLLIHITYRHDPSRPITVDETTGVASRNLIKNYHIYISDDKEHDALFVHHCLEKHAKWLRDEGVAYDEHWIWSDGAASQFKCARNFYYIARHHVNHQKAMRWFFFGSGHGKGEHDGAGGVIKRALRFEQLRQDGVHLENASDICDFLKLRFDADGQPTTKGGIRRYFWLIGKTEVNRGNKWGCKGLKGSRSLHVFIGCNPRSVTTVKTRTLCCMCPPCVDGDDSICENKEWCGAWETHELRPDSVEGEIGLLNSVIETLSTNGAADEDLEEEMQPTELASLVERGDNYAVIAEQPNPENVLFYLLKCYEPVKTLEEDAAPEFWSTRSKITFKCGERVIRGKYYQKVLARGSGLCSVERYMLLDDRPDALHPVHSVIYVNFPMTPYKSKSVNKRFRLEREDMDAILTSIENSVPMDEDIEAESDDDEEAGDEDFDEEET